MMLLQLVRSFVGSVRSNHAGGGVGEGFVVGADRGGEPSRRFARMVSNVAKLELAGRNAVSSAKFLGTTSVRLFAYGMAAVRTPGPQRAALQARCVFDYLVAMGPVYVKLGQIMATRSDLIPPEWVDTLRRLQDDAPHMTVDETTLLVEQELKRPLREVFPDFSRAPIASASIAQVHSATLPDGRKVAIKIVKNGVRRQLAQNLGVLQFLAELAHYLLPSTRRIELPQRMREVSTLLMSQADMKLEAASQELIHANFKGHPHVKVPAVLKEFVTHNMLVMDFMEGIAGNEAKVVPFPRQRLAQRLQDTIYTMLYMHGLCHGDPHPGNIFFTPQGELILLDFGITVELSEDEKWGLSSFYYACIRKEWDIAVERFTRHFVTSKGELVHHWDEYSDDLRRVLRHYFDTESSRWSTIGYFKEVNTILRKYQARYTTNFTKVELVFLSCEGFATQIDPEIDIWANARVFTDRYSPYMSPGVKREFEAHFQKNMPSSLAMRDSANDCLVAPTHIHRYFFPSAYPIFVKKASQGRVSDLDGNHYVDLSGGYGPHILGYAHPAITSALSEGVAAGVVNAIGHEAELHLAKMMVEAFRFTEKAILCNSGTEAVLLAIRLCRAYRQRTRVAKFEGHYHGFSDQGMVSSWFRFTGPKLQPKPAAGTLGCDPHTVESTLILQYGHMEGLERLRQEASSLACVICEPMPTSVVNFDQPFLQALRSLCTELDIPLIFDEVVTGFRVAYGGSQILAGVDGDLTCLGKVIGGGLPCGAVVGPAKLIDIAKSSQDPFFDYEHKAFAGGTMSGNSLSCAAGVAALTHLKQHPEIYRELDEKTNWLAQGFRASAERHGVACRINARNSIFSLSFSHRSPTYYREKMAGSNFKATIALAYYMRKHGVYMPELHSFLLSAAHTQEDLELTNQAFDKSLDEMLADGLFVT